MKTYKQLANTLLAKRNCKKHKNDEWFIRHGARIDQIMETAPSGSGFDDGTQLDEKSIPERLVFTFGYHHMNELGYYEGWTHHDVIVTGSLVFGFMMRILDTESEEDLDHFHEVFESWLSAEAVLAKEC